MNDLDTILNILPEEKLEQKNLPTVSTPKTPIRNLEGEQDFYFARENLYDIISKGNDAIFEMIEVAKQSQHPRAYEVLSTLINSLVSANKDLLDLHKKKKDFIDNKEQDDNKIVNNNLFVGSTAELQKIINDMKK